MTRFLSAIRNWLDGGARQQADLSGRDNVVVQIVGDGNSVVTGHAHLTLTRYLKRRNTGENGKCLDSARLLSPYAFSVPLVGRELVLEELWRWMRNGQPISVRVMTAPGGAGKTRLALELCDQAVAAGWDAGFVTEDELDRFRRAENASTWGWRRPTLVVMDYVASSVRVLRKWLVEIANHPGRDGKPLRLLLLERHADPAGGWWREVFGVGGGDTAAVLQLLDPSNGPYRLRPIVEPAARRALLASILERTGSPLRPPIPGERADFDRWLAEITSGGEPLFLLMAGLVAARADFAEALSFSATDLGFKIAGHELHRIREIAQSHGVPGSFLAHLAAYATLCQGLPRSEAERVIAEEEVAMGHRIAGGIAPAYATLFAALSGSGEAIAPILPDVLGEAIILEALGEGSADKAQAAAVRAARLAPEKVTASLVRLAQDYGAVRPSSLAWLEEVTAERAVDLDLLAAVLDQLPAQTLILREWAEALLRRAVELARREGTKTRLVGLLNDLSNRLGDLGKREEALSTIEEAIALARELVARHPEDYLSQLAKSLSNLSIRLSNLARRQEALTASEEAVAIHRELAAANPGVFIPDLTVSLNNLSNRLGELGRRQEALSNIEEVVLLRRGLAAARPDIFVPDLAMSITNLSTRLSHLGRDEEAWAASVAATSLYRELSAAQPDAFLPNLAKSLINLAAHLANIERRDGALAAIEEAVAILRKLAASRPDAFLSDLANSLYNLSNALNALGRFEEALAASEESVEILRELAFERPDVFRPELAKALIDFAPDLSQLGRHQEGLVAIEESVTIFRELAAAQPAAFCPELSTSIHNRATLLSFLGRQEESIAAREEAIRTLSPYFLSHPEAFQSRMSLMVRVYLAQCQNAHREPDRELLEPIHVTVQEL